MKQETPKIKDIDHMWGARASLEFVTGFLRPSSSKGHFGD